MRVIVQLREDAAVESQQLTDAAAELGIQLQPLHPGQTHPMLASYFTAEVPDRETADSVINRLSQFKTVEAAYLKPDDELP